MNVFFEYEGENMEKKGSNIYNLFFYCGLTKDEYKSIKPQIAGRNERIANITSFIMTGIGLIFLVMNLITRSGVYFPYIFLVAGGAVIILVRQILKKSEKQYILPLIYIQFFK